MGSAGRLGYVILHRSDVPCRAARFQAERWKLPVVFTENGLCNTDFVQLDGHVHVDFRMQKRTPKDFYHWYRSVIAANGANLAVPR